LTISYFASRISAAFGKSSNKFDLYSHWHDISPYPHFGDLGNNGEIHSNFPLGQLI